MTDAKRRDARRQTPDAKWFRSGGPVRYPGKIGTGGHLERFWWFSEAASQTGKHSLHVLQLVNNRRHGLLVGHPQEHGHMQVGLQLRSRTQCDVDKPCGLSVAEAAASLGDVRCDRDRRPAALRDETESFRLREPFSDPIDAVDDNTTSLPNLELPKVLHPPLVSGKRARWNALASSIASGVWGLASGVFSRPETFHLPQSFLALGVWRVASGVSSASVTAQPS